jgi:predicted DNA-binding transcriptional regulator AlpA
MTTHATSGYEPTRTALLSEDAARAELGGISRATLFRIRQRGELSCVRIGRRLFFRPADVEAYIEQSRQAVGIP